MAASPWCKVTLRPKTRTSKRSASQAAGIVGGKKWQRLREEVLTRRVVGV